MFTFPSARDVPVNVQDRVEKNIEEGRGVSFGSGKSGQGGVFDFASSNEMWRASIEVLDFVSFTNASYSGGIIITDWFSGNSDNQNSNLRELKIVHIKRISKKIAKMQILLYFLQNGMNLNLLILRKLIKKRI